MHGERNRPAVVCILYMSRISTSTQHHQSSVYQKFWYGPHYCHLGWMHISSKRLAKKKTVLITRKALLIYQDIFHPCLIISNVQRATSIHWGFFFEVMTQLLASKIPRVECERSLTPWCWRCLTVRSMVWRTVGWWRQSQVEFCAGKNIKWNDLKRRRWWRRGGGEMDAWLPNYSICLWKVNYSD